MQIQSNTAYTDFDLFLEELGKGDRVLNAHDIARFLSVPSKDTRAQANLRLAKVLVHTKEFLRAGVFAERAWLLSGFSENMIKDIVEICEMTGDYDAIRKVYKRAGIMKAAEGKVIAAIDYFNLWQYTYAVYEKTDKYDYDFDILDAIERLAAPYKLAPVLQKQVKNNTKKKIAHMIYSGAPALHKIDFVIGEHIDTSLFDISFVIPDPLKPLTTHKAILENLSKFNIQVISADKKNNLDQALAIADSINKFNPDILFHTAALADFWIYFTSLLVSPPYKVGLIAGALPLYITPVFDVAFAESIHITMDAPVDCAKIRLCLPLPDAADHHSIKRSSLNIPEDASVLICGGRPSKFQDQSYWLALREILSNRTDCFLIVLGTVKADIIFVDNLFSEDSLSRIIFRPSVPDYLSYFNIADIVLDTYPQSGGIFMLEAMAMQLPIITFESNYLELFDQASMSLADEICGIPELIVPRNDFEAFKVLVQQLLDDKALRKELGLKCGKAAHDLRGEPKQMVKQMEELYIKLTSSDFAERRSAINAGKEKKDMFSELSVKWLSYYFFRSLYSRAVKKIKHRR